MFALDLHPQPSVNCNTIRSSNFALYFVVMSHLHVFFQQQPFCVTALRKARQCGQPNCDDSECSLVRNRKRRTVHVIVLFFLYGMVFRDKLYCAFLARLQHSKICVRLVLCSVEKCCGASQFTRPPATTSATFPSAPSFIRSKFSRHCKVEATLYPEKYMHMIFQRRF